MNCPNKNAICCGEGCKKIAQQQAFVIAGPVMEAYASSEDLHDWHMYCQRVCGTKYPQRHYKKIETWQDVPEDQK